MCGIVPDWIHHLIWCCRLCCCCCYLFVPFFPFKRFNVDDCLICDTWIQVVNKIYNAYQLSDWVCVSCLNLYLHFKIFIQSVKFHTHNEVHSSVISLLFFHWSMVEVLCAGCRKISLINVKRTHLRKILLFAFYVITKSENSMNLNAKSYMISWCGCGPCVHSNW